MLLGLAYQQRARETGDPTYYTKSGRRAATARSPSTRRTTSRSAASARSPSPATASRDALALGEQALDAHPVRRPGTTA